MRFVLSAAERSGDLLGAAACTSWVRSFGAEGLAGSGGAAMRGAAPGARWVARAEDLGAAGIVEVIPKLPQLFQARRRLDDLLGGSPGHLLCIDAPDFHLPILRKARRLGWRTGQLVCPQIWAWRPQRLAALARDVDVAFTLWPFETPWLRARGLCAETVGHPAVDRPAAPGSGREPILALLPGSRPDRARLLLPALLRAARAVPELRAVVSWVSGDPPPLPPGVDVHRGSAWDLLGRARLAAAGLGTVTFEAALQGVPTAVLAALHPLTFRLVRRRIDLPFLSLPNLLLGEELQPEVVQDLSGEQLAITLRAIFENGDARAGAAAVRLRELVGLGYADRLDRALHRWWAA